MGTFRARPSDNRPIISLEEFEWEDTLMAIRDYFKFVPEPRLVRKQQKLVRGITPHAHYRLDVYKKASFIATVQHCLKYPLMGEALNQMRLVMAQVKEATAIKIRNKLAKKRKVK